MILHFTERFWRIYGETPNIFLHFRIRVNYYYADAHVLSRYISHILSLLNFWTPVSYCYAYCCFITPLFSPSLLFSLFSLYTLLHLTPSSNLFSSSFSFFLSFFLLFYYFSSFLLTVLQARLVNCQKTLTPFLICWTTTLLCCAVHSYTLK